MDFRHAWRGMLARSGFSAIIILTLALAIGANTAIFSLLQAVLFRPLPFQQPDRVMLLGEYSPTLDTQFVSPITYDDWRTRNGVFSEIAAFRYWQMVNLEDAHGEPQPIDLVTATPNFFAVLGVRPLLGRVYQEEQNPAGGSEAVISYDFWTRRYHRDPAVLGQIVRVRGTLTTIVGIMPPIAVNLSLGWGDVWTCLYRYEIAKQRAASYRARYLVVVGRLQPDLSLEQARARMTLLQHQLWKESTSVATGYEVRLRPLIEALTGRVRLGLFVMFGAVGLVLLMACVNVANLLLARASVRQRETAVRLALGAGPGQLVRLLLVESLCLAVCGAAAGVAVAWGSLAALRRLRPDIPRVAEASLTPGVLLFTATITIAAALLFSLAPLLALRRTDLRSTLTDGGRGGSSGVRERRTRAFLVASQMALACVLLVSGGLLFRSVQNLLRVDPGFQAQRALTFDLYLPNSRYPDAAQQTRYYRDLIHRLEDATGVQAAGALLYFPYRPKLWLTAVWIDDAPVADGDEPIAYYNLIAGNYFQAMGIPLKAGRWPTAREMWEEPRVALVNETLVRELFPTRSPLGRWIRTGKDGQRLEIIGVVGDVRQKRLDEPSKAELYTTFASMPMPFLTIAVRTTDAVEPMENPVRATVRASDPGLAIANLTSLEDYVKGHIADRRFALLLLGLFGALAVALGAVGVYGVMSQAVAQRRREMAIRLALGATPVGVRAIVIRDGLRLVMIGAVAGLVAAIVAGRLMRGLLFGVDAVDPLIYLVVPATLLMVAALAAWLPARRASRVEAMAVWRGE